jgi:hypothetical protein
MEEEKENVNKLEDLIDDVGRTSRDSDESG